MFEYPPGNETASSHSTIDVTQKSQALTKNELKGIWVPIVTPFENDDLDLETLSTLTKSLVESNVHGLVACSTTGEFGSLSLIEQAKVIETVLDATQNKVPVIVGINGMGTHELIKHAQALASLDISGFLIAPPPFVRPFQAGLIQHFNQLADATSKSVVLYNVPSRSGVSIEIESLIKLSEHPNIIGLKESSGSLDNMYQALKSTSLSVMCGDDALILDAYKMGASGAISAAAHIDTNVFVRIHQLMQSENVTEAAELFDHYLPLIKQLFLETNPAPVKALLAYLGVIQPDLRLPLTPISKELMSQLKNSYNRISQ